MAIETYCDQTINATLTLGSSNSEAKLIFDASGFDTGVIEVNSFEAMQVDAQDGLYELMSNTSGQNHTITGVMGSDVHLNYDGTTKLTTKDYGILISGELNISTINNVSTDTDKFLVSDSGTVKYRTGAQVLSDIGGAPASYINAATFATGTGIITGTGVGSAGFTVDIDGRYPVGNAANTPFYIDLQQNPVGTTYGQGVSSLPTYYFGQRAGDNDHMRIYAESASTNDITAVWQIEDDIEAGLTWLFRNKKTYSPYTATDALKIDGDGDVTVGKDLTVTGGDITLSGTGRIQGIDTVSASTDAVNKAYVDAQGGIGGSGTASFIPMFTAGTTLGNSQISQANIGTGNAKRITVSQARMTITGSGGDADGGTLNLTSNSARLGIATVAYPGSITEPEASLDVGKNARIRGSLNVGSTNEQYLFVSTTGDNPVGYVKMGYYGSGVEWGSSTSTTRTPQYTTGFGSGGKVVEDARYYTFKISFANMGTIDTVPRVLIAQDTGPYTYIIEDFYVFQDNASAGNAGPVFNSDLRLDYKWTPAVGAVRTSPAWVVPQPNINSGTAMRTRRTLIQGVSASAFPSGFPGGGQQEGSGTAYARASIILTADSVSSSSNSGDYYLRLKVKKVNINNDIINNTQIITIT